MTFFPSGQMHILPSSLAAAEAREGRLDDSFDGVIIDPRIYIFKRLENELAGGIRLKSSRISDLGREMVFERIIEDQRRRTGWPSGPAGPGLRRQVMDLLDQLKSAGVDPSGLDESCQGLGPSEKRDFLAGVYRSSEDFLFRRGLTDRAGLRRAIIDDLKAGVSFQVLAEVREVLIHGFSRMTPFQLELTKALASTLDKVEVKLNFPAWIPDLGLGLEGEWKENPFQESLFLIQSLKSLGERGQGLELTFESAEKGESAAPALAWLREGLFRPRTPGGPAPDPSGQVEIIAAPGRYAEVEEIGRRISALIDQGAAPERIAVAVHDLGAYGPLVEDVFRRFRLPLFFRRGEPLAIQAPVRAVLALLRLSGSHWDRDLVLDLLASPYLDLGVSLPWSKAAELSARAGVTDERAGGGWTENLSRLAQTSPLDRPEIESLLKGVKRLKKILAPLAGPQTWADMVQTMFDILDQLKLEERIQESPEPFLHRDAPAWAALRDCLEELAGAAREASLEHESLPPEALRQGLGQALAHRNIGAGGGAAGGIMVLSVYDLHGLNFDYLFLAGLNEGEFPRPRSEGLLLDDTLRRSINKNAGQRVLITSASAYRQEELLFHQALSAAGPRLVLSHSRMDERGRVRLPSALLDQVLRLWPDGVLEVIELSPQVTPPLERALTREELVGGLARHVLSLGNGPEFALAREVLAGLMDRPMEKARWETLVRRAGIERTRGLGPDDKDSVQVAPALLKPWLAELNRHQGSPLISPSFLQNYAQCPFAFWAQQVLRLEEPEEAEDEVSGRDEGSILHRILYRFLTRCRDEGFLPLKGEPKEDRLLSFVSAEVWAEAEKSRPLGRRSLWRARREAMSRTLKCWLEQEQTKGDEYLPTYFEWGFGPHQGAAPLEVPLISGGCLFFHGRVDRIDLSPSACLVIDYKNTNNKSKYGKLLKEEELGRTSFQAPLYQAAVSQAMNRPSQATWTLLRLHSPLKVKTPSTASDFFALDAAKRLEMSRNDSANFFNRLEDTWLNLTRGDFSPKPETGSCDFCSLRTICRAFQENDES